MENKREEFFTIYPIYMNISKSYKKGRSYNKSLCVEDPTYQEIKSSLKKLDIPFIDEPTKRHPRDPFTFGRFKIKKMYGKKEVIEGIKQSIDSIRQANLYKKEAVVDPSKPASKIVVSDGTVVENKLNLMARKKNKKQKKK